MALAVALAVAVAEEVPVPVPLPVPGALPVLVLEGWRGEGVGVEVATRGGEGVVSTLFECAPEPWGLAEEEGEAVEEAVIAGLPLPDPDATGGEGEAS